jgi:hypothetical protein
MLHWYGALCREVRRVTIGADDQVPVELRRLYDDAVRFTSRVAAGSPLAALRDLTADPAALLRRVGLRPNPQLDEGRRHATTD